MVPRDRSPGFDKQTLYLERMIKMKYQSTRGSSDKKSAAQAVIQGLSQDKGLFVPETIPVLPFTLEELKGKKFKQRVTNGSYSSSTWTATAISSGRPDEKVIGLMMTLQKH